MTTPKEQSADRIREIAEAIKTLEDITGKLVVEIEFCNFYSTDPTRVIWKERTADQS